MRSQYTLAFLPHTLLEWKCELCGDRFFDRKSRSRPRRYCSVRCYKAARERTLADRFWDRVRTGPGCWLSTGTRKSTGYGHIQVKRADGKLVSDSMHRVSWRLHFGEIPNGLYVLHRCDNRACVRPDHLFLGTLQDNHADMVAKGRHPRGTTHGRYGKPGLRGEQNKQSVLTEASVLEIRRRWDSRPPGYSRLRYELAEEYGISINTLNDVIYRNSWKHVP